MVPRLNDHLIILKLVIPNQSCQLSISFCNDETMRKVNHAYRGEDKITDVLSFSSEFRGEWQGIPLHKESNNIGEFVLPPDQPPTIGEVLICFPEVKRNAKRSRNSVTNEIALLVIHGILHALGYDHGNSLDKAKMWKIQKNALLEFIKSSDNPG